MDDPYLAVGLAYIADWQATERRLRDGLRRAERLADEAFALDVLPTLEARQKGGFDREMLNPRTGTATRLSRPTRSRAGNAHAPGGEPARVA